MPPLCPGISATRGMASRRHHQAASLDSNAKKYHDPHETSGSPSVKKDIGRSVVSRRRAHVEPQGMALKSGQCDQRSSHHSNHVRTFKMQHARFPKTLKAGKMPGNSEAIAYE